MENKNIIEIIGIIVILIFAGIGYAEATSNIEDLKPGNTVTYSGTAYSVAADPQINRNTGMVEITLSNGAKIKARSGTSLQDIARRGEAYAEYTPPATATTPVAGTPSTGATPPTTPSTTAGEGTADLPDPYSTGIGGQISPTTEPAEGITPAAGAPKPASTATPTPAPAAQPLPQRQWLRATAEEYEEYHEQERKWTSQGKKNYPNFEGWLKNKRSQDYEAWKAGTMKDPFRPGVFIPQFLAAYDQYRGLSRFGSLFFTGDAWEAYREKVNQAFCDTILLGGTQCWTSRLCDTQLYSVMPRSVFAGRTPSGQMTATATIQGEKSLPIAAVNEQGIPVDMRLYKVTYAIRNPYEEQDIKYNVEFRADDGYKFNWYNEPQNLGPGTFATRAEDNPLIDYGTKDYKEVCLIFNPAIVDYRNYHGRRIREWCSDIVQYMGTATKPYPTAANDTTVTPDPNAGQPPQVPTVPNRREGF